MTFCEMFIFHDFPRPGFFFHFPWFSMIFHDSGNPVKALRVLCHVQIGQEITCSEAKEGQLQQSSAQRAGGGGAGAVVLCLKLLAWKVTCSNYFLVFQVSKKENLSSAHP